MAVRSHVVMSYGRVRVLGIGKWLIDWLIVGLVPVVACVNLVRLHAVVVGSVLQLLVLLVFLSFPELLALLVGFGAEVLELILPQVLEVS